MRFFARCGHMTHDTSLIRIVSETHSDESYELAVQSREQVSVETAEYVAKAAQRRQAVPAAGVPWQETGHKGEKSSTPPPLPDVVAGR